MRTYKVIFAKDEIIMCQESTTQLPEDTDIRYEQYNGHLIHAFVMAENKDAAKQKAATIISNRDYRA